MNEVKKIETLLDVLKSTKLEVNGVDGANALVHSYQWLLGKYQEARNPKGELAKEESKDAIE